MSLTNLDIITNVECRTLFYSSLSYFLQFFSIDDKYYPSGSIDSRENLFARNKTTRSLPIKWRDRNSFFLFFLSTSNTITRHLITRLEIRFRCNHRETFGAWTAGQTERLPMNNGRCDAQSCAHNFRKTRIV